MSGDVGLLIKARAPDVTPFEVMPGMMFDLTCSLDAVRFVEKRLSHVIPQLDDWQVLALRCPHRNVLMLCGRQTGKSTVASIMACHCTVQWSNQLAIILSPTLRQSGELYLKTMGLIDALDPKPVIIKRTQTEIWLENGSRIVSLPGSNPESIRGFTKPALVLEDEGAFVHDKTFIATRPFFSTSRIGRHVLLSTPYGKRGHFYNMWRSHDPDWYRITIRSEDCPRISAEHLEGERRILSKRAYRQEYECEFLEAQDAVFADDWIERLVDEDHRRTAVDGRTPGGVLVPRVDPGPWAGLE